MTRRMQNDEKINFAEDWKVISLFIGGNDLCAVCRRWVNICSSHFLTCDLIHLSYLRTAFLCNGVIIPILSLPVASLSLPIGMHLSLRCPVVNHCRTKQHDSILRPLFRLLLSCRHVLVSGPASRESFSPSLYSCTTDSFISSSRYI